MSRRLWSAASILALSLVSAPAFAQTPPPQDEQDVHEVVVTSMRVRQGGAQDINHFRGEAAASRMPMPDTLTPEGLMGGYDLQIPGKEACARVLCLTGEAMRAELPLSPADKMLVGLGFNSSIDAATWKRAPLNLVAVVDKSGSMQGGPLMRVRESLHQILEQLRPGDQLSIVLYGDRSYRHLEPTVIGDKRAAIRLAIDAIESAGSTNMEAGLKVGYETAFATRDAFNGVTRVMLFTDEQPNVGRTDAESFMGMAKEASRKGVGLTTIGVGTQFDAPLATKVSSVRGGNLYFLRDKADVESVFSAKLDTMVSELAYDLTLTVKARPGYRISGVYGVPGDELKAGPDGAVSMTVPTAFLSTEGGGLFVSLAKAQGAAFLPEPVLTKGERLLDVDLRYVVAADGTEARQILAVAAPTDNASEGLRLAHVLLDEFQSLHRAATLHHRDGDEEGTYQVLRGFDGRLKAQADPRLEPERKLVAEMLTRAAFLAGYAGEARAEGPVNLLGSWTVARIDGDGQIDVRRGDQLRFSDDELVVSRRKRGAFTADEPEDYEANEDQLALPESDLVFDYRVAKDGSLVLKHDRLDLRLVLKRTPRTVETASAG
ncbi:VWA domain-containing protein [Caulobacter sp. 602-2]|uniref:VWA domain-containing protein n=1 Tax=Caulobacter sp. 602-2 TaxID=2710887 RepID=A0A6G4R3T4_9CAUL|nr:VWA domain-containing protein [Caulobacter sp. 602-2]NGM52387.1 VWA domain-containing protein [Caulobacter sp. 602-2]